MLYVGKPEGKRPLGKPKRRLDGWLILRWMVEKWIGAVWTGSIWLRIGTRGELL
jgi:hypothetical protein